MSGVMEILADPDGFDSEGMEPELDEVMQETYDGPAVLVRQAGPVTVHELPTRVAVSRNLTVTDTTDPPESIGNEDLRRKFLTVIVTGQPVYLGFDKQSVQNGTAGIVPVGVPITVPTTMPVFVKAASAGSAVVSYWAGYWAD